MSRGRGQGAGRFPGRQNHGGQIGLETHGFELRPLYPHAPKPSPLNQKLSDLSIMYKRLNQYVFSNYNIRPYSGKKSAFITERYSDKYNAPLALTDHLRYRCASKRIPRELTQTHRPSLKRKRKSKLRSFIFSNETDEKKENSDVDEPQGDKPGASPSKVTKQDGGEDTEPEEEDPELDMDTDYASNYFDNGEGYLDDDDDNLEDNAVY